MSRSSQPIVAIMGRPNVGKSTLFNRLLRSRKAIIDPTPGVTRDRHYAVTQWDDYAFTVVDTGGWIPHHQKSPLSEAVREQAEIAAQEADLILLVCEYPIGITEVEQELAQLFHRGDAPAFLIVNKVDSPGYLSEAWGISNLGLEGPIFISAKNGYGVTELLDRIVDFLRRKMPVFQPLEEEEEVLIAIIGAPNTGKSSLVNRLLGTKRMVVSETPGTTRDAVDTVFNYQGEWVRLVDTAGLKKRRYQLEALDFYATIRALRAIERSDVAVLLLDFTRGITNGDLKLAQTAAQYGVGLVVAVNKWDLIPSALNPPSHSSSLIETLQDMSAEIDRPLEEKATPDKIADIWQTLWRRRAPQISWAPMLFVSALTGLHTDHLLRTALQVKKEREKLIPTHQLNDELIPLLKKSPPPAVGGKISKIKYATQVGTSPPTFALFASYAHNIKEPYIRFSERLIRELYGFTGVPIRVQFRPK